MAVVLWCSRLSMRRLAGVLAVVHCCTRWPRERPQELPPMRWFRDPMRWRRVLPLALPPMLLQLKVRANGNVARGVA